MKIIIELKKKRQLKKTIARRRKKNKRRAEIKEWEGKRAKEKERERIARIPETIHKLRNLPQIELTQEEFNKLPEIGDFTTEWLRNEAPFGFEFICRPFPECPKNIIVLGRLVKTGDIICEQYGSGMSPPAKFINRYRVVKKVI